MKTLKTISALLMLTGVILVTGCSKESVGTVSKGAAISGTITYDKSGTFTPAPNALVWITFGATSASSEQDLKTFTDANGNYTIKDLNKGSYFVNAQYTDDHGFMYNNGGCAVTINKASGTVTANVALQ